MNLCFGGHIPHERCREDWRALPYCAMEGDRPKTTRIGSGTPATLFLEHAGGKLRLPQGSLLLAEKRLRRLPFSACLQELPVVPEPDIVARWPTALPFCKLAAMLLSWERPPSKKARGPANSMTDESLLTGSDVSFPGYYRFVVLFFNCLLTFGSYFCFDMPSVLQNQFQGVSKVQRRPPRAPPPVASP